MTEGKRGGLEAGQGKPSPYEDGVEGGDEGAGGAGGYEMLSHAVGEGLGAGWDGAKARMKSMDGG